MKKENATTEIRIVINKENVVNLCTRALLGQIVNNIGDGVTAETAERLRDFSVTLVFAKQTVRPNHWDVLEYNIPCLVEDVLRLKDYGVMVRVEYE